MNSLYSISRFMRSTLDTAEFVHWCFIWKWLQEVQLEYVLHVALLYCRLVKMWFLSLYFQKKKTFIWLLNQKLIDHSLDVYIYCIYIYILYSIYYACILCKNIPTYLYIPRTTISRHLSSSIVSLCRLSRPGEYMKCCHAPKWVLYNRWLLIPW